jgi:ATP-dependent Clp protease, protease subunit
MNKPLQEGADLERPGRGVFEERLRSWMSATERRFDAQMAASGDVLELTMLDIVGEDWWTGGGITSKGVQAKLSAFPKAKTIKILLNSPGGDAFEGLAIQALLRRHGARVEVEIVGLAASAASVIAMAGDSIAMHEGSMFMVHEPWTFAVGDAAEMRDTAAFLDKVNASALDVFERRTGRARAELAKIVSDETWMTAHEAVEAKFATNVISGAAPEPVAKARAAAQAFMSAQRRPQQRQREELPAPATTNQPATPALPPVAASTGSNPEGPNEMTLPKKIQAALNLADDADDAAAEAAIGKLKASAKTGNDIELLLSETGPAATGVVRALLAERENNATLAAEVGKLKVVNARRSFDSAKKLAQDERRLSPHQIKQFEDRFVKASADTTITDPAARAEEIAEEFASFVKASPKNAIGGSVAIPLGDNGELGVLLHDGKKFEQLKPMQRADLKKSNEPLYNAMREDAVARGAI